VYEVHKKQHFYKESVSNINSCIILCILILGAVWPLGNPREINDVFRWPIDNI